MIIACYFSVKAFSIDQVGSVGNLFELVQAAAQRHPVSGNQDGTYLTMTSKSVCRNPMIYAGTATDNLQGNSIWDSPHTWELWSCHRE
jgi:hypothetical protein